MTERPMEVQKVENILLELNKTGLSYLKYLQFNEAIDFFKKAEKIVHEELNINTDNQKINQLAGVTYNNLACYYKKTKRPKVALTYLKKSLELEVYKINDWVSTGSTHLNICAIYSYLGKHQQALSHAQLAIQLLQKSADHKDTSEQSKSYWNIKMLCYYNKAIEEEHLKIFQASLQSYKQAKQIAKVYGSKNVGIIINCDEAISRIETILSTLKKKMMNIFLRKKEEEEAGHYEFMRFHKPLPLRKEEQINSNPKLRKLSIYKSSDRKSRHNTEFASRSKSKEKEAIKVERSSATSKFKSLSQYLNQKYQSQPNEIT